MSGTSVRGFVIQARFGWISGALWLANTPFLSSSGPIHARSHTRQFVNKDANYPWSARGGRLCAGFCGTKTFSAYYSGIQQGKEFYDDSSKFAEDHEQVND